MADKNFISTQSAWNGSITSTETTNKAKQSTLDKVAKAQVNVVENSSAAQDLENLARGNFSLFNGLVGGKSSSGAVVDSSKLSEVGSNLTGTTTGTLGANNGLGSYADAAGKVKLARPVFTAGTSDVGATVDIYGDTLNSPQNKIKSVIGDVLGIVNTGISGILQGELAKARSKMNLISAVTDSNVAKGILDQYKSNLLNGVPLTNDSMKSILYKAVGYSGSDTSFASALENAKKTMLGDIVKNVDGSTGLITLYKNAELVIKGDYSTADGILKMVGNITSNTQLGSFLDLTNQMKLVSAVTKTLYNLGIPDIFEDIYNKLTHNDKERYVRENIASAASEGDIDFVEFALKYYNGSWLLSNYPNIIRSIVSSYKPKTDLDGSVSKAEYERLISILARIDVDWWVAKTVNGVKVGNLNVFASFNNHARLAFLTTEDRNMIRNMLIGEKYGTVYNTIDELQKRHPYFPIKQ